ncbi:MAG: hypothetical protein QOE70_5104 [Chthoniobacter sp.]|jgi:anti-sigma factor RsiW|nr:hypothetical protein [Chthoniobacter sp.]
MKTFEERFTAWIDGQLAGDELAAFENELAAHPGAAAEREGALKLGQVLRTHGTAHTMSNADFFNLQVRQRIEAETPRPRPSERAGAGWSWSLPRLAWLGGFCLLIAVVLFKTTIPARQTGEQTPYFAQVVEAWPSDPSISATTVYSPESNVTVLWLEGLDYLPASYQLQ